MDKTLTKHASILIEIKSMNVLSFLLSVFYLIPNNSGQGNNIFSRYIFNGITRWFSIQLCAEDVDVGLNPLSYPGVNFYFSDLRNDVVLLNETNLSLVDPSKTTIFLINGYLGPWNMPGFMDLKYNYVNYKNYQVINVDWDKLSIQILYQISICNTKIVGKLVAKLIVEKLGMAPENCRCAGLSLGGQSCAFVGKYVQKLLPKRKLHRITGIEPSLAGFADATEKNCLIETDANYVDVIHTDSGYYGYPVPAGTVDFWINGGENQPCCPFCTYDQVGYGSVYSVVGTAVVMFDACNHVVSVRYLAEAICNDSLKGIYCTDYKKIPSSCTSEKTVTFGENLNFTSAKPGNYFVEILPPVYKKCGTIFASTVTNNFRFFN